MLSNHIPSARTRTMNSTNADTCVALQTHRTFIVRVFTQHAAHNTCTDFVVHIKIQFSHPGTHAVQTQDARTHASTEERAIEFYARATAI